VLTLLLGIVIALVCGAAGFWLRQHTKLSVVEVSALLALVAGLIPAARPFLALFYN